MVFEIFRRRILAINEPYKLELLDSIKDDVITIYHIGTAWWDLCAGPHVESTGMMQALVSRLSVTGGTGKLNKNSIELQTVAGAYWRGDEKNVMLQVWFLRQSFVPMQPVVESVWYCVGDS